MRLYTGQMTRVKNKPNFLDITVKSGEKIFAPTWTMVMDYKNGKITEYQYKDQYYKLMGESWKNNKNKWLEYLNRDELYIGCYCKSNAFCHRYLLKGIFEKICAKYDIKFEYKGEIY